MSEEAVFDVVVRDFRATELTTRNRFKEAMRIVGDFDGKKFKTKKKIIGGGDVSWGYFWRHEYKIFSHRTLEQREVKLRCMLSKTEIYGTVSVDLYTIATGPVEHNLPITDFNGKVVGRLNFFVEMNQVSNIAVIFREIKLRHLKPHGKECNPYLKYAYSKVWPSVQDGKIKACYSIPQQNTTDPCWTDLPELRFEASLRELLLESIVLHVTHHGKLTNTTLGRCNLLFRTLVDNGKTFKDEDLISFKGPLKVENAEIEGTLVFKFLPKFAQMKAVNLVRKAIHTEKGIFDAVPLLPNLPQPKISVTLTEDPSALPVTFSKARGKKAMSYSDEKPIKEKEEIKKEESEDDGSSSTSEDEDTHKTINKETKEKQISKSCNDLDSASAEERRKRMEFFPHAEDPGTPTSRRKGLSVSFREVEPEISSSQQNLINFSPIAVRKANQRRKDLDVEELFNIPEKPQNGPQEQFEPGHPSQLPTFNPFVSAPQRPQVSYMHAPAGNPFFRPGQPVVVVPQGTAVVGYNPFLPAQHQQQPQVATDRKSVV